MLRRVCCWKRHGKRRYLFRRFAAKVRVEQGGRRPCIIVSSDAFNGARSWRSITVVPLTTSERWQTPSPTTVLFKTGECGLPKDCAALAHQITTIDRAKLIGGRVGSLTQRHLLTLRQALQNYLDLNL